MLVYSVDHCREHVSEKYLINKIEGGKQYSTAFGPVEGTLQEEMIPVG